ncbi:TetR/AcrR family transcriptional regulator [Streptomyces sp. N2-109]|uniref:TetR/AcrR family transcriptional regulator n=1 Tax=Streptomyces gossypii TaxID=2883101 RepID=A0ABT2K095_9ACTN|nr:TetR/AcrR family transcriptional regulator [Streptomyces gossypii]MCT2593587.1 TetR/AcrR family transcriptional regulator [Streptomyces gossypii]
MGDQKVSRRARLRAETSAEIKAVALALMAEGGPDAISLRAIAREMGMTAGAIYGYFATRDDLITTLINDVYTALLDAVEAARDGVADGDPAGRIVAWAQTFREWSLGNPEGFRLIYGDPVPGYKVPEGGPAPETGNRACAGLTGLIADAWPHAERLQPSDDAYQWSDFDPHLVEVTQERFPELPPAAVALALRVWARMHGLVSLEVYGHLRGQTRDPDKLYRAEVLSLVGALGLPPAP